MTPSSQETSTTSRGRAHGFTFVEILVVVVIIGIATAGAILAVSVVGRDRELDTETERLVALMNYAREQAELQTRELGLLCDEHGYEFLAFDPRRGIWDSVAYDDVLRARKLPEGLRVRLVIEGRPVLLGEPRPARRPRDSDKPRDGKLKEAEDDLRPHLMIFSNGDLTPFELTLEREGTEREYTLLADEQGRIVKQKPEDQRGS